MTPLRFAINGLGRIGRALVRIAEERPNLDLVAVNDLMAAPDLARLLARDSVRGAFSGVSASDSTLAIRGRTVAVSSEPEPSRIPWERHGAQVVVEATGRFLDRAGLEAHLKPGVGCVIAAANSEAVDRTFCLGLEGPDPSAPSDRARERLVSNASCTTNCAALVLDVLDRAFGVERALFNTVHGYTGNQRLLDTHHADARRSRAAALNLIPIPSTTPAAVGRLLPALAGRVAGFSLRVPTPAVALLDLAVELGREASTADLASAFRAAASGPLAGLLGVADDEPVSTDFLGDPRSAVVDLGLLQSLPAAPRAEAGSLVRVAAWYDNEWGYTHRLADLLERLGRELRA